MGIADEKLYNLRRKRQSESSLRDYDYSKKLFFLGWGLFLVFGYSLFWAFGYLYLDIMKHTFGPAEDLDQVGRVFSAVSISFIGYLFGQVVGLIILRHLGKKWQGNLHFGSHPVLFISLVSLISFNICFFLLLTLILSLKPT